MFLSEVDFVLADDSWIEDHSPIFGILYDKDIFKYIEFYLAHLAFQEHFDFKPGCLTNSESRAIYCELNIHDWWWDTRYQLSAGATLVPVICASDETHFTNFSGDQHVWLLYLTIGNIRKNMCCTPKQHGWILIGLIPYPPKGSKNTDKAWHFKVGTVQSPLWNLDITGPSLK